MKIKKIYIIIGLVLLILIIGGYESSKKWLEYIENKPKKEINTNTNIRLTDSQTELLHTLVGLEAKEMKVVDNPLRIEGKFKVPEKTILNYINYYLKSSNNKEVQDVKVSINNKNIKISAKYELLKTLKTPIEISIVPSIINKSNINLHIEDIKVLGLSVDEDIIDAVVASWFSNTEGIKVKNGDVILNKSNFKDITVQSISMEENSMEIRLSLKIE